MIAASVFAVCSLSVFADDGLFCGPLSLTKGETGTVEVFYIGEKADYSSITFTLSLPEGVLPSVNSSNQVQKTSVTFGDVNECSMVGIYNPERKTCNITIEAEELGGKLFKQNKGLLATIQLNVDESVASGLASITVKTQSMAIDTEEIEDDIDFEEKPVAAAIGGVPVVINGSGYATSCSAKALDFSAVEEVEAVFTVSKVADGSATLSPVESKKVPANAGVVVKGTSGTVFVPFAEGTVDALGTNLLVGVTTATAIAEGCYIVQENEFVSCIAGTLPGGKAYLPAEVASSAKSFTFDFGEPTGINEIQTEANANGAIYNLNGARVSAPQKGVYIMNGRKVIVK